MDKYFKYLLEKFTEIKQKEWIQSNSKSTGAIGITFEKELGLLENNSFYPDFSNIEIKCISKKSRFPITLFSLSFDGPGPRELRRIVDLYGYPDETFKDQNVLFAYLSCIHTYSIKSKYSFKLEVNRQEDKIYLVVYDMDHNIIDRTSFIYFGSIKTRLITKMKNLAIIYGDKSLKNNISFYKYTNILLYTLKDFNTFLTLLENGEIQANIAFRINKSAHHFGKLSSKNIVFTISKDKLDKLYNKLN